MNEMEDKTDWVGLEEDFFKEVKCYKLILGEVTYRAVGLNGTMGAIDKKAKSPGKRKILWSVVANPQTYLDKAANPLIPFGFWTCECETSFVRTPYLSTCNKCGCSIKNHTYKAEYIKNVKF